MGVNYACTFEMQSVFDEGVQQWNKIDTEKIDNSGNHELLYCRQKNKTKYIKISSPFSLLII